MGYNVFVSYKHEDSSVIPVGPHKTVRDYVDILEKQLEREGHVYRGEPDGENLSRYREEYIAEKLRDKIFYTSVTVLFISPKMRESSPDETQWIPWEISYSLREQSRDGRVSHSNAIVAVVLPERPRYEGYDSYKYYGEMTHFDIVNANIKNGYAQLVFGFELFIKNVTGYINLALQKKEGVTPDKIVKTVYPGHKV